MEHVRKRILLIIPELIVGGAQRSFSKISVELSKHHDVSIAIFNHDLPIAYEYGGTLYSLDVGAGGSLAGKFFALRERIKKLKELKHRLKTDVSISFLEGADYINVLSRVDDKIVLSVRGSKIFDETMKNKFHGWRSRILIPWLYKKADHIVVVNQGIEEELRNHFRIQVPVSVIHNFYSSENIARLASVPPDQSFDKFYELPVIVTTGRLAVEKGLYFLLNVFSVLRKTTKAKLMLVGDGPEYSQLVAACKELNLSVREKSGGEDADVIFAGNQENVFSFLARSSVYVLASSSEGFPNSLVEAMFCGIPVVAADCPYGPREILTRGSGIRKISEPELADFGILMPLPTADEKVVNGWARMLRLILGDERLRNQYSQAGRKRAQEFSTETALEKWLNVIR